MKQMLKPFVVIVLLTTIFIACKKGVEDTPPVNKLTASFSVKGDGAQGPCTDTFTVTSTGAERYSWKFGDGSVTMGTDKMVTHLYNGSTLQDTTYTVTLTAYAGKDSAMATKTVLVKQRKPIPPGQDPVPDFTFTDNLGDKFESPCTIKFTNTSQYGETYLWDFGNGVTSKATDTMFTYTVTGTMPQKFTVTLTAYNKNNSISKPVTITINPKGVEPLPENVDFSWTPTNPKVGDTVTFTAALNITHAAKYIWQFNDGPGVDSTSGTTVKHVYKTANTLGYSTTLYVKNNTGGKTSKDKLISVSDIAPKASFTVSTGPYSVLKPITFTSTSTPATGLSYKWVFGDGAIDSTSGAIVQHAYKEGGDKTVTLYVKNSEGSSDYTYQIAGIQDIRKVTITSLELVNAPLQYYDTKVADYIDWDDELGTGDQDDLNPDFYMTIYRSTGPLYRSNTVLNKTNPSWDLSSETLEYNLSDVVKSRTISIYEESKKGTLHRFAFSLAFTPSNYTTYPPFVDLDGKDGRGENVKIRLSLKWE